jgi:hypothetical protein
LGKQVRSRVLMPFEAGSKADGSYASDRQPIRRAADIQPCVTTEFGISMHLSYQPRTIFRIPSSISLISLPQAPSPNTPIPYSLSIHMITFPFPFPTASKNPSQLFTSTMCPSSRGILPAFSIFTTLLFNTTAPTPAAAKLGSSSLLAALSS